MMKARIDNRGEILELFADNIKLAPGLMKQLVDVGEDVSVGQYIIDGRVLPKPPNRKHVWNGSRWVLPPEEQQRNDKELQAKEALTRLVSFKSNKNPNQNEIIQAIKDILTLREI